MAGHSCHQDRRRLQLVPPCCWLGSVGRRYGYDHLHRSNGAVAVAVHLRRGHFHRLAEGNQAVVEAPLAEGNQAVVEAPLARVVVADEAAAAALARHAVEA